MCPICPPLPYLQETEADPEGLRQGLLDNAIGKFTPKQVMEVKYVLRMLPVFFTTIFYWCEDSQTPTVHGAFLLQSDLHR